MINFGSLFGGTAGGIFGGPAGAGAGAGLGGKIDDLIGGLTGGGKEAGYGRAKPNTLPWYIDKLKGVSDNKAIDVIAPEIIRMRVNGASDQEIRSYLKSSSNEGTLGPEEYNPILDSLDSYIEKNSEDLGSVYQSGNPVSAISNATGLSPILLLVIGVIGYKVLT